MTDLMEALRKLYRKAYLSDAKNRVAKMDRISVALQYASSGNRDLAWAIAKEMGIKP